MYHPCNQWELVVLERKYITILDCVFLYTYINCNGYIIHVDMSGIIPEDEDEEQEIYDDAEPLSPLPIDEDIYEELPGERGTKTISTLKYSHRYLWAR